MDLVAGVLDAESRIARRPRRIGREVIPEMNAIRRHQCRCSPELAARFDTLVEKYPVKRSALIPMLLYAQDEVGYLSDAVVAEIGRADRHHGNSKCATSPDTTQCCD